MTETAQENSMDLLSIAREAAKARADAVNIEMDALQSPEFRKTLNEELGAVFNVPGASEGALKGGLSAIDPDGSPQVVQLCLQAAQQAHQDLANGHLYPGTKRMLAEMAGHNAVSQFKRRQG